MRFIIFGYLATSLKAAFANGSLQRFLGRFFSRKVPKRGRSGGDIEIFEVFGVTLAKDTASKTKR